MTLFWEIALCYFYTKSLNTLYNHTVLLVYSRAGTSHFLLILFPPPLPPIPSSLRIIQTHPRPIHSPLYHLSKYRHP